MQSVISVVRAGAIAVLDRVPLAEFVVVYAFDVRLESTVFVAVHSEEVSTPNILIGNHLSVGISHLIHTSPAVVGVLCFESIDFVAARQGDCADVFSHIAKRVVETLIASATVHDMDKAAGLVAGGAISIFDVITCHITITFVPGPVVCIVVISSHIIYNTIGRRKSTGRS